MLPCKPALPILHDLLLARAVQHFRDLVPNTTLALRLLFKILQYLVAGNGEPAAAGGILGHVKPNAFL